jgi:hypothetical protein
MPDSGTGALMVDKSDKLCIDTIPTNFCLNYVGTVVQIAVPKAIPICKMWGIQFYVTQPASNGVSKPVCVPAWLIPQMVVQAEKEKKSEKKKASKKETTTDIMDDGSVVDEGPPPKFITLDVVERAFDFQIDEQSLGKKRNSG